jgi:hypothetical protein
MDDWTDPPADQEPTAQVAARQALPGLLHQAEATADKAATLAAVLRTQAAKLRATAGALYGEALPRPQAPWPTVTATLAPEEFEQLTRLLDHMEALWPGETIDDHINNLMGYAIAVLSPLHGEPLRAAMDALHFPPTTHQEVCG